MQNKQPSVEGVWISSGTIHCILQLVANLVLHPLSLLSHRQIDFVEQYFANASDWGIQKQIDGDNPAQDGLVFLPEAGGRGSNNALLLIMLCHRKRGPSLVSGQPVARL